LEPGAIVVFTHGLTARPLSTAFFASSAAPSITDGFEVLVHEVIAEITTAPWSSSNVVPSAIVTGVGLLARPLAPMAAETGLSAAPLVAPSPGTAGSLAGKVSSTASSTAVCGAGTPSA